MEIRLARVEELEALMALYDRAREFMREQGNAAQWVNGYPSAALIAEDIARSRCHVCCEGDELLAVFAFERRADDPTYRVIRGAWPDDGSYGVIHRIAVGTPGRDVAGFCFDWCAVRCRQLRADTHADNRPMQRAMEKNGFACCGLIQTFDGTDRLAYARPATVTIRADEGRRLRLLCLCLGLYGAMCALALALVAEAFWLAGWGWMLVPLALALLLPGLHTIVPRLRRGGSLAIGPAGLDNRLADTALHGRYPWDDFIAVRTSRSAIELTLRDPAGFLARLPRRARRALRQRRVRNLTLPLPVLLLSARDRTRAVRLIGMNLEARKKYVDKQEKIR